MTCLLEIIFFFFNDTATTEIYTLSLHDALPISQGLHPQHLYRACAEVPRRQQGRSVVPVPFVDHPARQQRIEQADRRWHRSEEHTSELQSRQYLVCRLLLEKKK